jgi:hypothetical protein
LHRGAEFGAIKCISVANFAPRAPTGLKFIHDAIVHMFECGKDDPGEAITILTHTVDAGLQSCGLRAGQHLRCHGAMTGARAVHAIEQEKVAEVEDTGACLRKIKVLRAELRVGATGVEKRPTSRALNRHYVSEAGRRCAVEGH